MKRCISKSEDEEVYCNRRGEERNEALTEEGDLKNKAN